METWQVYGIDGELLAEYQAGAAPSTPQKEYGYRGGELLITATNDGEVRWLAPKARPTRRDRILPFSPVKRCPQVWRSTFTDSISAASPLHRHRPKLLE